MAFIESGKGVDKDKQHKRMKKLLENMDVKRCTIRIPTPTYHKFRVKICKNRTNMKDVLHAMILKYIEIEDDELTA